MEEQTKFLEKIRDLKEKKVFERDLYESIADDMEDILGPAEMWRLVKYGFSTDELIENLEYIAKEADI